MEAQQLDDKRNRQLEAKAILIKAAIRQKMNEVKAKQQESQPQYLNEFHKKNSEGVMNHIEESKKSPIGFEEAQKQILKNSKGSQDFEK